MPIFMEIWPDIRMSEIKNGLTKYRTTRFDSKFVFLRKFLY